MDQGKQSFRDYVLADVKKYKGIAVPVRTMPLKRLLVKKLPCRKLHPNPDDEFCFPDIGPNDEIISKYMEQIRYAGQYARQVFDEPLIVQKIRPDGYMLLNGHHRWAAAVRMNLKKVPVKIVNLTQTSDIAKMLGKAVNSKRATLDLDEVVFRAEQDELTEKPPKRLGRRYPEYLRLGTPSLFSYLSLPGYDVWVYSANYHSFDHIRHLFRRYSVNVTGIVTGTGRKRQKDSAEQRKLDKLIAEKYPVTLHIDEHSVVRFENGEYTECPLAASGADWSAAVMDAIKTVSK